MKKFKASVIITLRQGILDVQGKTVEQALHSIEFTNLTNLRIGKFVEINVEALSKEEAMKNVDEACKKLIANPIIEDFKISLEEIQ